LSGYLIKSGKVVAVLGNGYIRGKKINPLKNSVEISSDDINVYVTSTIRATIAGKIILTLINLLVLGFYIFFLSTIELKENGKLFIPIILMFIAFIYFPWRYWFWNFYGKENIIINTKTITHYNDYGIVTTKSKTVKHQNLGTTYELVKEYEGEELGKLIFWSYNIDTNLPESVYETTVLISKKDIEIINQHISKVFDKEFRDKNAFSFSQN
jgi:hypothetical protein